MQRAADINEGIAMIVTDLHGEAEPYYRLRDTFFTLRERGEAHYLIFCGDLIHGYGPEEADASMEILLDVMRLQDECGADTIMMLLGNHEMPHIYGVTLAKGDIEFTPRFEAALVRLDRQPDVPYHRQDVIAFLKRLPFYVRTRAGVLISHAGASASVQDTESAARLLNFNHDALLQAAYDKLSAYDVQRLRMIYSLYTGALYDKQVRHFLAVEDENDPRYNDLLNAMALDKNPDFTFLWDVLFSPNELAMGREAYEALVPAFLRAISTQSAHEQRVLVAGHITARDGCELIGSQQLRLASHAHARPRESGRYLLLDCASPIHTAEDLLDSLRWVQEAAT